VEKASLHCAGGAGMDLAVWAVTTRVDGAAVPAVSAVSAPTNMMITMTRKVTDAISTLRTSG
jgi:hypothetical protein